MARTVAGRKRFRKAVSAAQRAIAAKKRKVANLPGESFSLSKAVRSSGNKATTIISRTVNFGQVNENNTTGALSFKLSDLPSYAEFSLYDQYRFIGVKVQFINLYPANQTYWNAVTAVQDGLSCVTTCVDLDDNTTPGSEGDILRHDSAIVHGTGHKHVREFVPAVASALYQGAFTGYGSKQNQWIDTASSGVQHFGLKYAISYGSNSPGNNWGYLVYATYVMEFRNAI